LDRHLWKPWDKHQFDKENEKAPSDWVESAFIQRLQNGKRLIAINGSGEDFDLVDVYCFDEKGEIQYFASEFKTAWGWSYVRLKSFDTDGKLIFDKSQYVSGKERSPITSHQVVNNVIPDQKFTLYRNISQLPFKNWIH